MAFRYIIFFCLTSLAFTLTSCNNDEDFTGERIPLKRIGNEYAPVISPISEEDFQNQITTGGWIVGYSKKVNYDGSLQQESDETILDDWGGTLYTFSNGATVKQYDFIVDPLTDPKDLIKECSYTYTSQGNYLTITSPNFETSYQVLSINKDSMYCTRSIRQFDGCDYAIRLFIFRHLTDDEVGSVLRHFRMEDL